MGLSITDYFYMITGIFSTYITYRYMRVFFDTRRTNSKIELISYLIYYIFITIIYFSFNVPILNLISNILLYFVISFNYRVSMKTRIISITFIYMILVLIESIIVLLSGHIYSTIYMENPHYSSVLGIVTLRIISFIVVLILENYKDVKRGINISSAYWLSIFLIPLGRIM